MRYLEPAVQCAAQPKVDRFRDGLRSVAGDEGS
jgi:hypothetical protein